MPATPLLFSKKTLQIHFLVLVKSYRLQTAKNKTTLPIKYIAKKLYK